MTEENILIIETGREIPAGVQRENSGRYINLDELKNVEGTDRNFQTEGPKNKIWTTLANVVSLIMHPFLMPLYAVLLLLFGDTVMNFLPLRMKLFFTLVILVNTFMVPALCVGLLRSLGYLKDLSLETPRDRRIPLLITAICYVVCAFMVNDIFVAFLVRKFLLAGAACVIFALIVNYFWKISLHMIAVGGALSMLLIIVISGLGYLLTPVIVIILLSGMLASARLYLGHHTPLQVTAGFFGGFIVAATVVLLP